MREVATLLFLATVGAAAPVPKDFAKEKPDPERFVGAWEIIEATHNGQPFSKATWTFDAALKMRSVSPGGRGPGSEWTIKLDPAKSPKEIDITQLKGIYAFAGADLKIAYRVDGTRPTGFDPQPGLYYNLLRRLPDK